MDTEREQELVRFRRHLHAHPELGRQEYETTRLVSSRLEQAGLPSRVLSGGTGLVCDLGEPPGPVVALRADLDALPVQDDKAVPYRSTRPGVCHACGHDVHTAILLGAGLALAELGELPGRVRLLFQPAEESVPSGSLDAIADGVLDDVSLIYGLHCDPGTDAGRVGVRSGPITSASDSFDLTLRGKGGHSARPHLTSDLIQVMARVITQLPADIELLVPPETRMLIAFGAVHAGKAFNAIPNLAEASGTVRMPDPAIWDEAPKLMERVIEAIVAPFDIQWELDYARGCPAVDNDERATDILAAEATELLGEEAVFETPQSLGGEDFGWYVRQVPGSMARLGVRRPGSDDHVDLHSGVFDVDERAIAVGVDLLVATARAAMRELAGQPG